jgi:hypothetical protein
VRPDTDNRLTEVVNGDPAAVAMFIAKKVRDAMEDFHVEHLTDDQMKVLNPIIRNAIYRALLVLDMARSGETSHLERAGAITEIAWSPPDHSWEPPTLGNEDLNAELEKLGEIAARRSSLLSSGVASATSGATVGQQPISATVDVIIDDSARSRFRCPNCGKMISYRNAYPLSFMWKVCKGCRLQWIPVQSGGIDLHADDISGTTQRLRIVSSRQAL